VSAFCRAIISKVIPQGFWGNEHNKRVLMYWVDQFIDLRRFESLNLHQVTQNVQVYIPLVEEKVMLMDPRSRT
jgi:telomerase reverse transcriptase